MNFYLNLDASLNSSLLNPVSPLMNGHNFERPPTATCPNILLWNYRGAGNRHFRQTLHDLPCDHKPNILILSETKVGGEQAHRICNSLLHQNYRCIDTRGFAGEIWMLWKLENVTVHILGTTEQEIHAKIEVSDSSLFWFFTAVYASLKEDERNIL